jgi:DNA-binding response OmpR family regulator
LNLNCQIFNIFYTTNTLNQQQPHQTRALSATHSKFILIGEDDLDDQEFLKEIFNKVDDSFELTFISKGMEVVNYMGNLLDTQRPCLIVLDYNMPGLNGAQILQELRKTQKFDDIPKIIWSTSGSEFFKNLCREAGAIDYVTKPSNLNDLTEIVRYMVSFC